MVFECDARRTILIDDSPYKACISPPSNCIFPPTFNIQDRDDNVLLRELLPYLQQLNELNDLRWMIIVA